MSSAARRAPTETETEPLTSAPEPEAEPEPWAEVPTRISALGDLEVRALFEASEGETARAVDVSGLEMDDLPTRAVPSSAPARAVSLSDDGIVVPIEVFDPLPETGVRPKTRSPVPEPVPEPVPDLARVPERLLDRLVRLIATLLRRRR